MGGGVCRDVSVIHIFMCVCACVCLKTERERERARERERVRLMALTSPLHSGTFLPEPQLQDGHPRATHVITRDNKLSGNRPEKSDTEKEREREREIKTLR